MTPLTAPADPSAPAPLSREPNPALAVALLDAATAVVRGHDDWVRLAISALLADGHLLVEGPPGTGKTLLARTLANAIGGRFARVQCTPDLLPSDITGSTVYSPATGQFDFRPGPVFADVVMIDELNRASPRTQAALLEPMEERQVTVDGVTRSLPNPHFVIATQNPFGSAGTFPLPESQLDRFVVAVTLTVADRDAEREVLAAPDARLAPRAPVAGPADVAALGMIVRGLHCAAPVLEYVLDVVAATRAHPEVVQGPSTRAAQALLRVARAHAVLAGRDFVVPSDVQAVAGAALAHRVTLVGGVDARAAAVVVASVLEHTAAPRP